MKDRLVEALKRYLAGPITTEEQVLYVLVSIRKLFDLDKLPSQDFLPLRFVCNWPVHVLINQQPWSQEILKVFDNILASQSKSWEELSATEQHQLQEILSLDAIRDSLMNFLKTHGIMPIALGNPYGWLLFLQAFARLVDGCPLKLNGGKHIDNVTVRIEPQPNPRLIEFQWIFTLRNSPHPFVLSMGSYAEPPEFAFGRTGQAVNEAFLARLAELGYTF